MGGHKQSLGGDGAPGPTVATALATSTKMVQKWLILCTHSKKQQSHTGTLTQGCKFEFKLEKKLFFFSKLSIISYQYKIHYSNLKVIEKESQSNRKIT